MGAWSRLFVRNKESQAEELCSRGDQAFCRDEYEEAIAAYSEAIELNPRLGNAFYGRANAYLGQGKSELAETDMGKAVDLNVKDGVLRIPDLLGLKNQYRLDEANRALEHNPHDAEAYFKRGHVSFERQEYASAESDFAASYERKPDDPSFTAMMGFVHKQAGRYPEAISLYSETLNLKPHDVNSLLERGFCYTQLGMHQGLQEFFTNAIADYSCAILHGTDDSKAYLNRGVARMQLRDYDLAIEDLDRYLELNPRAADGFHNRGITYWQAGRLELAREDFRRAISLDPEFAQVYEQLGCL